MTQPKGPEPTWEEELALGITPEMIKGIQAESAAADLAAGAKPLPAKRDARDLMARVQEYDQATGIRLPSEAVHALMAYAERYTLDPYARHVMILYGAPYLTEKGAIAYARRDPKYRGYSCRNLQAEELAKLGEPPGSIGWLCSVWMEGYKEPVEDYGIVNPAEGDRLVQEIRQNVETDQRWRNLSEMSREREIARRSRIVPLLASPSKMAKARAIRRAHERAVPLEAKKEEL